MSANPEWLRANRAIRAACKDKGLDDDARRDTLLRITGQASSRDCDAAQLRAVLLELNGGKSQPARRRKRPQSKKAHVRKIYALWWAICDTGEIKAKDRHKALAQWIRNRMVKVDDPEWMDEEEGRKVIEALKSYAMRVGAEWDR